MQITNQTVLAVAAALDGQWQKEVDKWEEHFKKR
jgi:hypothetical protein